MSDLRLIRIMEECDESIHKVTETLKDMRAGMALTAEVEKLLRRLRARVPVIEQQMAELDKEYSQ